MLISEIGKAMGDAYRTHKKENGGHKTAPKGKYGYRSVQFKVVEKDGTVHGPFLGRGSALRAYKAVKDSGKTVEGLRFRVETIFKPKAKGKTPAVDGFVEFPLTTKKKAE